jgi:hypothetical protein
MRIYVAGEVPREDHTPSRLSSEALSKIYDRITEAASKVRFRGDRIEVKLPYPDREIDELDPKSFVEHVRDEIQKSDAVLTVFFPPGIAVGFEAQLASKLRKPQTILIPKSLRVPRYLRVLPYVGKIYPIEDIQFREVLVDLANAVQESAGGIQLA